MQTHHRRKTIHTREIVEKKKRKPPNGLHVIATQLMIIIVRNGKCKIYTLYKM